MKTTPRSPIPRYGIAEWFGKNIITMTPENRQTFGKLAAYQDEEGDLSNAPICPFLSMLVPDVKCNKASGVCSIRKFSDGSDGAGHPVADDRIVTVCPFRFLQRTSDGRSLLVWISKIMLDIDNPIVVKETPFLRKVSDITGGADSDDDKKAGRIDWILVNPTTMAAGELEWCAVETQSLYFSGDKMRPEFDAYAKAPSSVLFPVGRRRPDYRSSGPKRLSPQLDVKVPVLRSWGKKIAVAVDRFFFNNMNGLADSYPRAKNDKERRDNADVIWFVMDYDSNLIMTPHDVVFSTLESSRTALNATEPLSKFDFTNNLKQIISDMTRTNKIFKV